MTHKTSRIALACAALLLAPAASWAATFTVDRADDALDHSLGDGLCYVLGGGCTLRAAIEQASALPGPHTIAFDFGGAPTTISVGSSLPEITRQVTIDGYTNGGTPNSAATGNNAVITVRIDGFGSSMGTHGLRFHPGASQSVLRGVAVTRFPGGAVVVNAQGGSNLADVTLAGNFFGLDLDGTTPLANDGGAVQIGNEALRTTVGGSAAADRNVIVASASAVGISVIGSDWTRVAGNYIGTDRTGNVPLGTQGGVYVASARNVGVEGNVIGARDIGVTIDGGTQDTWVRANRIGVGAGGANIVGAPGSRHGVYVTNGSSAQSPYTTRIGSVNAVADGNTIAHWQGNGVRAERLTANASSFNFLSILGNSIGDTGGEGIELVDTAAGQGAAPGSRAPNTIGHMPRPVITSVAPGVVNFTLTGAGQDQLVRFEVFASPACHAGGWGGGSTYLGSVSMMDNGAGGNYSGSIPLPALPAGTVLTMTASGDYNPGQLSTSEFSQCAAAVSGPVAPPAGPGGAAPIPVLGPVGLGLLSAVVAGWGALRRRRED